MVGFILGFLISTLCWTVGFIALVGLAAPIDQLP